VPGRPRHGDGQQRHKGADAYKGYTSGSKQALLHMFAKNGYVAMKREAEDRWR